MHSTSLHTLDIAVDTPLYLNGEPLKMAARRYSLEAEPPHDGITLLFVHGIGTHKETWEPTIDALFRASEIDSAAGDILNQAWTVDWQTHGDSAVLNDALLKEPYSGASIPEFAQGIKEFVDIYLAGHRLICVGHSGGAITLLYSTMLFPTESRIPYECMILVEPGIVDRQTFAANGRDRKRLAALVKVVLSRRDEWDSREAALAWFLKRAPWKNWDPRVVRLYIDKGLRLIEPGSTKVTTKCNKIHEAQLFSEHQSKYQAVEQIERLCDHIPMHMIFGENKDFVMTECKACLTDVTKGRRIASISVVPGAGHMVPQEQPDRLAALIQQIVSNSIPRQHLGTPSKYLKD